MISERHHWGPQTVYQAEKPGAPESETQKRIKDRVRRGHIKRGVGGEKKLVHKGLQ